MRESMALWLLYRTVPGRLVLKLLVQSKVSKIAGDYLSSGASKWIVPHFIRKHRIDMSDITIPIGGFSSFNDFFTRKRGVYCFDVTLGHLISPCDGLLTFASITENTMLNIKNTEYTLEDLLEDHELAGKFKEGTALIFRLTPANYHRYCYAADGEIIHQRKIKGVLHCVRPVALRTVPVFARNSREYQVIETEQFGTMIQMEVGALLVGKIRNREPTDGSGCVQRGEEKGYFEFGGSTIILLLRKDAVRVNEWLCRERNSGMEIPVRMGECVARAEHEKRSGHS